MKIIFLKLLQLSQNPYICKNQHQVKTQLLRVIGEGHLQENLSRTEQLSPETEKNSYKDGDKFLFEG